MASPSVTHRGFIVPNAVDVLTDPVLAEPDRVDYNTVANARWGVIEGCQVSPQGAKDVFVAPGSAIVDGLFVNVLPRTLQLPTPDANQRFTLIVVDEKGEASLVAGQDSTNPVLPDPGVKQTALAAVLCKAGASSFADYVIDKRKFLAVSLLTKIGPDAEIIRNFDEPGTTAFDPPKNHYVVMGDGKTTWANDTVMLRVDVATLQIIHDLILRNLSASGRVDAVGNISSSAGLVLGRNLRHGGSMPAAAPAEGDNLGDIWQDSTNGRVFIRKRLGTGYEWQELATTESGVPVGTIIQSLEVPSKMLPLGWYPMNGQTIIESAQTLRLFGLQTFIGGGNITGTAPNRQLKMPNLARRVLLTDHNYPGRTGGDFPYNILELKPFHLPRHGHNVGVTQVSAGTPTGQILKSGPHGHTVGGGWHDHVVSDPGHYHNGANNYGIIYPFIAVDEGGSNKLDALFNDRSHTFSVTPTWRTVNAYTGINVIASVAHGHDIGGGEHLHTLQFNPLPLHDHTVTQSTWGGNAQGLAEPIDITPEYYTVFCYIRS